MKRVRRIAEPVFTWLALWLAIHSLHWLLVHYFGSVLPPAFSPATWAGDGIDAFVVAVGMAAHEWNHKFWEKRDPARPDE